MLYLINFNILLKYFLLKLFKSNFLLSIFMENELIYNNYIKSLTY